jgi:hypothetical protein
METVLNKKVLESALNAFIIALVTQFVENGAELTALTGDAFGTILNSAIAAAVWVVFRAVNPKDHKFGIGAEDPIDDRRQAIVASRKTSTTKKKTAPKKK